MLDFCSQQRHLTSFYALMFFSRLVIVEVWATLEYHLVVAPPLQVADLSRRVWLVVDHDIRIVAEISEREYSRKGAFDMLIYGAILKVCQTVNRSDIGLPHIVLLEVHELLLKVVVWIVPSKMKPVNTHCVQVINVCVIQQTDVHSLIKAYLCSRFLVLSEQFALLQASCDVRIADFDERLTVPKVGHICNFD